MNLRLGEFRVLFGRNMLIVRKNRLFLSVIGLDSVMENIELRKVDKISDRELK